MILQSEREVANTREKLRLLEETYDEVQSEPPGGEELRELELQSLKKLINQLKEEIASFRGPPRGSAVGLAGLCRLQKPRDGDPWASSLPLDSVHRIQCRDVASVPSALDSVWKCSSRSA
jgi:hypothetical protein